MPGDRSRSWFDRIRRFAAVVWQQGRTALDGDVNEETYVNLRRVFVFVERSIDRGLQWVGFEPGKRPAKCRRGSTR